MRLLLLLAALSFHLLAQATFPKAYVPTNDIVMDNLVGIPMRDGVKLFTKIFTPKNQTGPLPFVFRRTPYGIDGAAGSFT
ncbi:MAG: X-Pro dipeptidyl-peptidase, partial [Acidobacteriota bacterium]